MTTAARLVLSDCEAALQDLVESEDSATWRRRWFTLVALLRTVGHVLDKVDGGADPRLARIVSKEYKKLKASRSDHKIYWNFIEEERNLVLKEYRFSADSIMGGTGIVALCYTTKTGELVTVQANRNRRVRIHFFRDGPFEGKREIDVATEAIQWWKAHLDAIDAQR